MKKLILILLLLVNVLSVMAFTVKFDVAKASDIIVTKANGGEVKLVQGLLYFEANLTHEDCNPLTIKPAEGLEFKKVMDPNYNQCKIDDDGAVRYVLSSDEYPYSAGFTIETRPVGTGAIKFKVKIDVDKATNVTVTKSSGAGAALTLVDGQNEIEFVADDCNPLTIAPVAGTGILKSVKKDGASLNPSGDGKYRAIFTAGGNLEIRTETVAPPLPEGLNFNIAEPDQVIIKLKGEVLTDLSKPVIFGREDYLEVTPAPGYKITKCMLGTIMMYEYAGAYGLYMQLGYSGKALVVETQPLLTFNIDFSNRIKLFNNTTNTEITIPSSGIALPKGTTLRIEPSDEKYSLKTVTINETDGQIVGRNCSFEINNPTNVVVKTNSTIPGIKFIVNDPSKVKAYFAGSEEALNLSKTYEVQKNTKLIIECVSDEFRIASVVANGFKLDPLANGKYELVASKDLVVEIIAKRNIPTLTFNVDAPERIKVLKGEEVLNFAEPVDLDLGTKIVIEPASVDFRIKSLLANNEALTPGEDKKYQVVVNEDIDFDIQTAALLTLHIVQPVGGTISVTRSGVELQDGDKVNTGEVLYFKNVPNETYIFTEYSVNEKMSLGKYTVTGSEDLTVTGVFRTVKEGFTLVKFDFDTDVINVRNKNTSEMLDTTMPCEIEQGNVLSIYLLSVGKYFKSLSVNGTAQTPDEENEKFYTVAINGDNMVIKAVTYQKVSVSSDVTTYPQEKDNPHSLATLGKVLIKYKGETAPNFLLSVGDEIELVPVVLRDGFEFGYIYKNYDPEVGKIEGRKYTILQEDAEGDSPVLVFKGTFTLIPDGIENIDAVQSYYDASAMQIVTGGGNTTVYTASGEKILDSDETRINVSAFEKGIYIVKTQDRLFKISK